MVSAVPLCSNGKSNNNDNTDSIASQRSTRRQWSVRGEPRSVLKRLRSQLAEDGCPDSQYFMAKNILDSPNEEAYEENCQQAVFWLIQSSLQGIQSATLKLQECWETGLGICEENYEEVKKCIDMNQQEKLAQVAAKQLFCSLCKGNEFVSLRKLNERIEEMMQDFQGRFPNNKEIEHSQLEENELLRDLNMRNYLEEKYGSLRLRESCLIEASKQYITGNLPSIPIRRNNKEDPGVWRQIRKAHIPILSLLSRLFNEILKIPTEYIIIFITCTMTLTYFSFSSVILLWIPYAVWFGSFTIMVYSTTAIMNDNLNFNIFNTWSLILKHFCPDLDTNLAKLKFKRKHIEKYLFYFCCLLIYLTILPYINDSFLAFNIPLILCASFVMFTALFRSNFLYNILSSFLYILAQCSDCHPYIYELIGSKFSFIEPYIIQESFDLWRGMQLNLNIGSIFYSIWLVSVIFVSFTLGLTGVLHHLLCIMWFRTALIAFKGKTDIIDICYFALWLFILCLPFSLTTLVSILPVLTFTMCVLLNEIDTLAYSVAVSLGMIAVSVVGDKWFPKVIKWLKIILILVSLGFLFKRHVQSMNSVSILKWEHYQNMCVPSKETISALTVKNCRALEGTTVQWQGIVKQVEIESVTNWAEFSILLFPKIIHPHLKCLLGASTSLCTREDFLTDTEYQQCLLIQSVKGLECSTQMWNSYSFKFIVSMESTYWKFRKTTDIVLRGNNAFANLVFSLSLQDKVNFIGTLSNGIGSSIPEITLLAMNCVECAQNKNLHPDVRPSFKYDNFEVSFKSVFNFFFSPTLTF